MEAQVWTLIALMGTALMGLFFFVATRFDSLNGRFDSLDGRLDAKFDSIDRRFDRHEDLLAELSAQIYRVESKLDEHLRRHSA